MTESERQRARGLRGMTRRQFVVSSAAGFGSWAVSEAASRVVLDPIVEDRRVPRSFASTTLSPARFAAQASVEQQAALAFWQIDRQDLPQLVEDRCTRTYRGSDGRRWMKSQGGEIRLWEGFFRVRDIPMEEQPDGEYGAWAASRLDACELRGEPVFEVCRGMVRDKDGNERVQRYTAILLPYGSDVVSVTARA